MVKQVINTGVEGNDATGDPIRDAFNKVNDNFNELYAYVGKGGGISFTKLEDVPSEFEPGKVLAANNQGNGLVYKTIVGENLTIDSTSSNDQIKITAAPAKVSTDSAPKLGGYLDCKKQFGIYDLPNPDPIYASAAGFDIDLFAINKGYADTRYVNADGDTMTGPLNVPTGATGTQVPQAQEVVRRSGGIDSQMINDLILHADPAPSSNPLAAATKNYVDTNSFASQVNLFVSTSGDDYQFTTVDAKKGRALSYAFKTLNRACREAEKIIKTSAIELSQTQKIITYNSGANFSTVSALTAIPSTSEFYLDITNSGSNGTDPRKGINYDIRPGQLIQGFTSKAIVSIISIGDISNTQPTERYTVVPLVGTLQTGEQMIYGDKAGSKQITIHVESGEYYENYPIRVPENTSIVGDDVRRTIIRPRPGPSSSIYNNIYFRRDTIVDGITVSTQSNFGYLYLTDATKSLYSNTITNAGSYNNAVSLLVANRAFIQEETIGYINQQYKITVTSADSVTNRFTFTTETNNVSHLNSNMSISFSGTLGGVIAETVYYVKIVDPANKQFTISATPGGTTLTLTSGTGSMIGSFAYNQSTCYRDVGLIVDAIAGDLNQGGYANSLEAGISYLRNSSGAIAIGDTQIVQTSAAIQHIGTLINAVLTNGSYTSYQTGVHPISLIHNYTAESLAITIAPTLITLMNNIITKDSSFNVPKYSENLDVFLLNNATSLRDFNCQGHGGFMSVFDPEGAVLTKSPYILSCSSISGSTNYQRFAGGIYADGFCGNLRALVTSRNDDNVTITVQSDAFKIRLPITPCSFYISGVRYEVDYIDDVNQTTGTATVHLNKNTPDISDYNRIGTSITANQTNVEFIMSGNRSMLCSHYTQINDMGYGIVANNNAYIETVSVFAYYCYRSYYSLGGAQIRSVNGSCSFGQYGLCAEGADPTELASIVNLIYPMIQTATTYSTGSLSSANGQGTLSLYVNNLTYVPLNVSLVDVHHTSGVITTYSINTAATTSINGVYELKLSTTGGLIASIPNGSYVTIRTFRTFRVGNVINVRPTRPSTALVFVNESDIYRVYSFTKDQADQSLATLYSSIGYNYIPITTDLTAGQSVGSGQVGDTVIRISALTGTNTIRAIGKQFGWWGTIHTIVGYQGPTGQNNYGTITITPALTYTTAKESFNNSTSTIYAGYSNKLNIPISSVSRSNNVATITTAIPHGLISSGIKISSTGTIGSISGSSGNYTATITNLSTTIDAVIGATITATAGVGSLGSNGTFIITGVSGINLSITIRSTGTSIPIAGNITNIISNGNSLNISNVDNTGFNATNVIATVTSPTTFTYTNAGSNVSTTSVTNGLVVTSLPVTTNIIVNISLTRVSSHDMLSIGTGSYADTNFPNNLYGPPNNTPSQLNEIVEIGKGRVFYTTVDQDGIIRFGNYFSVDQGTGNITTSGSVSYSNVSGIGFSSGVTVNEFSTDSSMFAEVTNIVPVQAAIVQYINRRLGFDKSGTTVNSSLYLGNPTNPFPGYLPLNGIGKMLGTFDLNNNRILNLPDPLTSRDPTTKDYVDTNFLQRSGGTRTGVSSFTMNSATTGVIDMNSNKIINLATPTSSLDGANKLYIDSLAYITKLSDVNITTLVDSGILYSSFTTTGISSATITSVTGTGPWTVTFTTTSSTTSLFVGGCLSATAGTGTLGNGGLYVISSITTGSPNTVVLTVTGGTTPPSAGNISNVKINRWTNSLLTDSNVSASAAISQSKLNISNATTGAPASPPATNGLASFDNTFFTSTNGYISLRDNGITLSKIVQLNGTSVIGNTSATTGAASNVLFSDVVSGGGGLRRADFTGDGVISKSSSTFSILAYTTSNTNSTLVYRDASGNFAGGTITAQTQLTVGQYKAIDSTNVSSVNYLNLYSPDSSSIAALSIKGGSGSIVSTFSGIVGGDQLNVGGNKALVTSGTSPSQSLDMYTPQGGIILSSKTVSSVATTTVSGNWVLATGATLEATYADLAEYYDADKNYDKGTVLMIGGDHEVTIASGEGTTKVVGVVSTNPAYTMNVDCVGNKVAIALQGRVPCKVIGKIERGDLLVVGIVPGVAMASADPKPGSIIGKALQNYDSDYIGIIEVIVGKH